MERTLPLPILWLLLWPPAAAQAMRMVCRSASSDWSNVAHFLRPSGPVFLWRWRALTTFILTQSLAVWPDRLSAPRWHRRIKVKNLPSLLALQTQKVPVVLATLHTRSLTLLRYAMRLHGIRAATLVMDARGHNQKTSFRDALMDKQTGLDGIPNLFDVSEIRSAMHFLRNGGCLIMACDTCPPKSLRIHTPKGGFTMALGPLRMARSTGATVFPAIILHEKRWKVLVHIGDPLSLPSESPCGEGSEFQSVCEEFAQSVLPMISQYPEQVEETHAQAWSP